MACLLSAQQLSFQLNNGNTLFTHISASFSDRVSALVGVNGVGKSVLGQCLSGLLPPSSGTVHCNGQLAYVPQSWFGSPSDSLATVFNLTEPLAAMHRIETGNAYDSDFDVAEPWWDWAAQLSAALQSVGITDMPDIHRSIGSFSGGEQFRLLWARAVMQRADFYIFDEPTNHLDREGREQFSHWLQTSQLPTLLITHDRQLLDTVDCIYELTTKQLHRHPGNYQAYFAGKQNRWQSQQTSLDLARKQQRSSKQKAQQALEKAQQRAAQGKAFADRTGMDKMMRDGAKEAAENSQGQQKAMRQLRESNRQATVEQAAENLEWFDPIGFELPGSNVADRKKVISLQQLMCGYDTPLHAPLTVELSGAFRLHLQGVNGSGKTLLIKTLMNQQTALSGEHCIHVPFAHLDQHFHHFNGHKSAIENFLTAQPELTEREGRDRLAWLRLRNTKADVPFGSLSGGEQLKVVLASQLLGKVTPQLLILDEPTNHLDLDSLQALEKALTVYQGAMIIISHDVHFMKSQSLTHRLTLPNGELTALHC